jgi:GAF domain-containing protein
LAENLVIDKNQSLEEQYKNLLSQVEYLLDEKDHLITNLANLSAVLKQTFEKINWAGIYLFDGKKLYLGPFQGKIACTQIELGKGVCGTSALKRKTIIVPDVDKFPGHIVCDSDSRSEIVVPIIKNNNLFGVLDLDSSSLNSFDETDKTYLEKLCKFLSEKIIK